MNVAVYASASGEGRIACYNLDSVSGRLADRDPVHTGGHPTPLAIDPSGRFLFCCDAENLTMRSYRIDRSSGELTPGDGARLEAESCFLSTDRTGRYLLSAYFRPGMIAVHSIRPDGGLVDSPVEVIHTKESAHCIQTDPSNRYAFVPHTKADAVYQFIFDEDTGRLSPGKQPVLDFDAGTAPRHFCFHPILDVVYIVNERSSTVTSCHLEATAGTLSAFDMLSTIPEHLEAPSKCSQIRITPSGDYLYAANRGHNSIACFAIDGSTGRLTPRGHRKTDPIPRAFDLDPSGRFLLVTSVETGRVTVYRIDPSCGELSEIESYELGETPMWIITTTLESNGGQHEGSYERTE
jgi:6-phosphogluconolactonase